VLEFMLLILWIWLAITVIMDVFRSHDLNGWKKAFWLVLIVLLPLLGVLIYVIARPPRDRRAGGWSIHPRGSSVRGARDRNRRSPRLGRRPDHHAGPRHRRGRAHVAGPVRRSRASAGAGGLWVGRPVRPQLRADLDGNANRAR
jgi:predicted membrane channel-forming protein YqfA (hemolysin III family)